jgi:ribulose-phosphate 3-epimerase
MSVNPGFAGQQFIPAALEKLADARRRIDAAGREVRLEVDGGVKTDNIAAVARAGADTFVAGSAIFGSGDYARTIREMRAQIERVAGTAGGPAARGRAAERRAR